MRRLTACAACASAVLWASENENEIVDCVLISPSAACLEIGNARVSCEIPLAHPVFFLCLCLQICHHVACHLACFFVPPSGRHPFAVANDPGVYQKSDFFSDPWNSNASFLSTTLGAFDTVLANAFYYCRPLRSSICRSSCLSLMTPLAFPLATNSSDEGDSVWARSAFHDPIHFEKSVADLGFRCPSAQCHHWQLSDPTAFARCTATNPLPCWGRWTNVRGVAEGVAKLFQFFAGCGGLRNSENEPSHDLE